MPNVFAMLRSGSAIIGYGNSPAVFVYAWISYTQSTVSRYFVHTIKLFQKQTITTVAIGLLCTHHRFGAVQLVQARILPMSSNVNLTYKYIL